MNLSQESFTKEETRLSVLRLLQENPQMTQRELAETLGVSLGKTNFCIKALLEKGLRRFLSINAPADLSFRPPALLCPPLHGSPCAGGRALQGNENPAPSGTFISGNRLIKLQNFQSSRHKLGYSLN